MRMYYEVLNPEPRFADTIELDLADMLTTEAQGVHEREQLEAVKLWVSNVRSAYASCSERAPESV